MSRKSQSEAPKVTSIIIDGAAIVQMLKPGGVVWQAKEDNIMKHNIFMVKI